MRCSKQCISGSLTPRVCVLSCVSRPLCLSVRHLAWLWRWLSAALCLSHWALTQQDGLTGRVQAQWITLPPHREEVDFRPSVQVLTERCCLHFYPFFLFQKKGPFQRIPKLTDPCVNLLTSAGMCWSRVWNTCVFHLPCLVMQLSAGGLRRGHCPEVWVLSCSPLLWVG